MVKFAKDLHLPTPSQKSNISGGLATIPRTSLTSDAADFMLFQNSNFMNNSGESFKRFWNQFVLKYRSSEKWDPRLIVLRDELDLPIGEVKYKPSTRATNGHNGLKSMKTNLEFDWSDMAIGIDRPASKGPSEVAKYVLSPFNNSQKNVLFNDSYPLVRDTLIEMIHSNSIDVSS